MVPPQLTSKVRKRSNQNITLSTKVEVEIHKFSWKNVIHSRLSPVRGIQHAVLVFMCDRNTQHWLLYQFIMVYTDADEKNAKSISATCNSGENDSLEKQASEKQLQSEQCEYVISRNTYENFIWFRRTDKLPTDKLIITKVFHSSKNKTNAVSTYDMYIR